MIWLIGYQRILGASANNSLIGSRRRGISSKNEKNYRRRCGTFILFGVNLLSAIKIYYSSFIAMKTICRDIIFFGSLIAITVT
jgi:hypothetical protein